MAIFVHFFTDIIKYILLCNSIGNLFKLAIKSLVYLFLCVVVRRKTIYEYHRVNFQKEDIKNWTVIHLTALPTCLDYKDCDSCLSSTDTNFDVSTLMKLLTYFFVHCVRLKTVKPCANIM